MSDHLPPHDIDAERAVLGHILQWPQECIPVALELIKTPTWFYDLRHQVIWEMLVNMWDKREPIETASLMLRLRDANQLDPVGGPAFLSTLCDLVVSSANLPFYLNTLKSKFIRRRLIQAFTSGVAAAYEVPDDELDSFVDEAEREVLNITQEQTSTDVPVRVVVQQAIDTLETRYSNQGRLSGLDTGFQDLNRVTDGLQNSDMIVIAARPSVGKTSFAMNIAEAVALNQQLPVGVFSLEMSSEKLVNRMIASYGRVNFRTLRDGNLNESDFQKITLASSKIAAAPLYIDDRSALSIMQIRAKARRWHQQYGIRLLIIDYMQLAQSTSKRARENRQVEVSEISNGVKALAKDLNIPVIVLAQLNRDSEKGTKKQPRKPKSSDLRESGAIEQDADLIGLLHNEETDSDAPGQRVSLIIGKNRNGPECELELLFLKCYTRFEQAAKVKDEDVPEPEDPIAAHPYKD